MLELKTWLPLENFNILGLKMAILVQKTAPTHQILDQKLDQNGPSPNFDGLSLTRAKIFAFDICLENRTNFEDENSVFTRFIYLMVLISVRS